MEKMASLSREQLKQLFTRVDSRLNTNVNLYIIGGASAILGYNVTKETNDIDVDGAVSAELSDIFSSEAKLLHLDVHLSSVGVFFPPERYRERAQFEDFPKRKLRVWFLDQYDLAISKIDRGIEKDFEDIERVHKKSTYDYDRLIQIFNDEYIKTVAIGNPREKKMNLVDLIARLFGEDLARETASKLDLY